MNLMDIYYKAGKDLYEHDFDSSTTEKKKKLVEASLKTYLAQKIMEEDISKTPLLSNDSEISIDDLVIILGNLIPQEEHFDTMRHLTHYLLNIAGEMQGWSITWWEEQDAQFIDNPLIDINESGKWNSLTTHKETSYAQSFRFVYQAYKNQFMEKNIKNKQHTLLDTNLK